MNSLKCIWARYKMYPTIAEYQDQEQPIRFKQYEWMNNWEHSNVFAANRWPHMDNKWHMYAAGTTATGPFVHLPTGSLPWGTHVTLLSDNHPLPYPIAWLQTVVKGVSVLCDRLRYVRSFDTKLSPQISREPFDLESQITKFYLDIRSDIVYSHTRYDVIIWC